MHILINESSKIILIIYIHRINWSSIYLLIEISVIWLLINDKKIFILYNFMYYNLDYKQI